MISRSWLAALLMAATAGLVGCDKDSHDHRRDSGRYDSRGDDRRHRDPEVNVGLSGNVVIVQEPPRDRMVVVRSQPPAPYAERIPRQPTRDAVWIPGYWVSQRNQWVWVSGRWEVPPRRNAHYENPQWEKKGTEFHFSIGGWR